MDAPLNDERLTRPSIFRGTPVGAQANIRNAPTPLFLLIIMGVVIRLVVNPAIVVQFYDYTTPGGNILETCTSWLLFAPDCRCVILSESTISDFQNGPIHSFGPLLVLC